MIRKVIKIDEDKCNGCGECAVACHEGAIVMNGGKAKLDHEDYCDGLGDCLPACPTNAISFEEREAQPYNEEKVKRGKSDIPYTVSRLKQWPCQIKLVPVHAPYFENADLLIAADCTAYAYADFHNEFMCNKITLIGCPKLDNTDYADKLRQIMADNNIKSITVVRMEVPCCTGIERAIENVINFSRKIIRYQVITVSTEGIILK